MLQGDDLYVKFVEKKSYRMNEELEGQQTGQSRNLKRSEDGEDTIRGCAIQHFQGLGIAGISG